MRNLNRLGSSATFSRDRDGDRRSTTNGRKDKFEGEKLQSGKGLKEMDFG